MISGLTDGRSIDRGSHDWVVKELEIMIRIERMWSNKCIYIYIYIYMYYNVSIWNMKSHILLRVLRRTILMPFCWPCPHGLWGAALAVSCDRHSWSRMTSCCAAFVFKAPRCGNIFDRWVQECKHTKHSSTAGNKVQQICFYWLLILCIARLSYKTQSLRVCSHCLDSIDREVLDSCLHFGMTYAAPQQYRRPWAKVERLQVG